MNSIIQYLVTNIFQNQSISTLLNQAAQVYCFTYSILHLLTMILHSTKFIYAQSLLKLKTIGIFSFLLFWAMKLWLSYAFWMKYVNIVITIMIAIYFYDGCCNITDAVNKKQKNNFIGVGMFIISIILIVGAFHFEKYNLKNEKYHSDAPQTHYILLGLGITYFLTNIYRMRQRSLFPFLITFLLVSFALFLRQLFFYNNFLGSIPLEHLVYLLLIMDAEGRQYLSSQNIIIHHLALTSMYFYGYVILNEPNFHSQYFLIGVGSIMMAMNK